MSRSSDATAKTLSIKEALKKGGEAKEEMFFTVADNAKVMVHGKAGSLTDLKAGDSVTVKHFTSSSNPTNMRHKEGVRDACPPRAARVVRGLR